LISWEEFLAGKRKRADVAEFALNLMDNILDLHRDLTAKTYRHGLYQSFKINDPKLRHIHKASVRDRLIHHAIYRILYPYFDRKFIYDSYSCRKDKGTHRAMNQFRRFAWKISHNHTRTVWVLKCDIRQFFASIDQNRLKTVLARHISDRDAFNLIGQVIDSFQNDEQSGFGLPLGNLTSQLLINVYMNEFDQFVKRQLKVKCYLRYADDFVVLSADRQVLAELLAPIKTFLRDELALELHPRKVSISTFASGVDFLGWIHFPDHRVLRRATRRRVRRNFQAGGSQATKQSYLGILKHGNAETIKSSLVDRSL